MDSNELGFNDVVRISDLAMRRIISMAKQLSMFMKLSQKDQIAILKGKSTNIQIGYLHCIPMFFNQDIF